MAKKVYLVYGSPLSGKTSYVNKVSTEKDIILDIDKLFESISMCGMYNNSKYISFNVFRIRKVLFNDIKSRLGDWENAYIIGTYPKKEQREKICLELDAIPIHIDTDKKECIKRLYSDSGGRDRDKWIKYIENYFNDYEE